MNHKLHGVLPKIHKPADGEGQGKVSVSTKTCHDLAIEWRSANQLSESASRPNDGNRVREDVNLAAVIKF
jgi:hypothetical protein